MTTISANEAEVNEIMAEVNAEEFINNAETKIEVKKNVIKTNKEQKKMKKNCNMDKNTKMSIAKNAGLFVLAGVCEYFKLASPILYIPVGLVCLCTVCFKAGEYKGKAEVKNV